MDAAQERKRRRDAGASSEREDAGVEESGGEEGGRRRKDKVTSTAVMEVSTRCLFVCVVSMDSCVHASGCQVVMMAVARARWLKNHRDVSARCLVVSHAERHSQLYSSP